ncbi:fumarylacetoacetase [Pseudomonas turukhanskensis]|uniref:fumarylacetoacetase n=1 Tax=Pseudomonas turukhanskensis TaxID=1806536 RepID=A0A9W6K4B2_9PSED|nr:fumarylacetoacetase [Pseudomonas turukhanskensis]GLK88532.1 fumarylacetoacetase [Pseudomonas turukhanskensis]
MSRLHSRRSWVESANGHPDFPLDNLPFGVFSPAGLAPRAGVAIGDYIFDLSAAGAAQLFTGDALRAANAATGEGLNALFALGSGPRRALRDALLALLDEASPRRDELLHRQADCRLHLPAHIGDYTDFYVGIHHAENVGKLFRPDNPLLPNYKYVPIGYHGRASTVGVNDMLVRRPLGQTLAPGNTAPNFGPSKRLDYELELGIWIGPGNDHGQPVPIGSSHEQVAGFCLLNDWSARDLQAWEYQPLGPFLSKSFATTVSPWVVTPEALEPFRQAQPPRPDGDPQPLPYLWDDHDQRTGALAIELEVLLLTNAMREAGLAPERLALSNTLNMYWTVGQMISHHTVNGCKLQAGDLLGSGTLSGPQRSQLGSLLELTEGGKNPLTLGNGETRTFLQDGDEIILRARCTREGFASIGFGECRGRVSAAL